MDPNYKGIVWTKHALDRMDQRSISQSDAWATFNNPEFSRTGSGSGTTVYYRNWGGIQIEVVAKKENNKWIIVSVWSKPIYESNVAKPKGFLESLIDLFKMLRRKS